jgi:hypothetical protein
VLCKNLGREFEAIYLFVTNIGLLPFFIFGFGFVSLYDVSVHLLSFLLKSNVSIYARQDLPRDPS